jgi:ABC-type Fe3+-hydroxamate transport system substrate-binding protein
MTRTVVDLGCAGVIVGRTPWCTGVEAPVVGTLLDCDLGRIAALEPHCILVQAAAPGPELARFAGDRGARLVVAHVDGLADIEAMVDAVAGALRECGLDGVTARRQALKEAAQEALERARTRVAPRAGRWLLLFAADPPGAFGRGTYLGDLWEALGGRNAVERTGYPELSLEDIVRLDPEGILLVRATDGGGASPLSALPARLRERITVLVAPELLEPSSAFLVEGPGALARALDPAGMPP